MLEYHTIMEDILWKFPHVGKQIFKKLSNKNLAKSRKVAKTWEYFITNEKFYKLKVYYETKQKKRDRTGNTPLHHAAIDGNLLECKLILDNVEVKNPEDNLRRTPLHWAARNGHLSICQLIINHTENKNARCGPYTTLHHCASDGEFDTFKLIFDNIEDKNPLDRDKNTLLHNAAKEGHLEICKYIVSKVEDKNLAINSKSVLGHDTPFQLAQRHRHQHVVDFMKSQMEN